METWTTIEWWNTQTGEWMSHSQAVRDAAEAREYVEAWNRVDTRNLVPVLRYRIVTTTTEEIS